jgi:exopolysaccharide production protein ExoZ
MANSENKLEGLQAARAIAALTVAYFHSYIAMRGFPDSAAIPIQALAHHGYLGVNFFFAISGYVICLVATKPGFTPRSFVVKRIFRLYPMYWVAMAVIVMLIALGKYRIEPVGHFLYSMTLLPQQGASAYDVSWTLEREMVFYALATIAIPFTGTRGLAFVLAGLAALGWWFGNPWSFHLFSTTQADFLAGVVVFLLQPWMRKVGSAVPLIVGCSLLWYTRSQDFIFSVSICMAVILTGMINLQLPWKRRPFKWLIDAGNASYSIYLLHYIVFALSAYSSARIGLPDWMAEPWRYGTLLACCFISYATWKMIEQPMIALGNKLADSEIPGGQDLARPLPPKVLRSKL